MSNIRLRDGRTLHEALRDGNHVLAGPEDGLLGRALVRPDGYVAAVDRDGDKAAIYDYEQAVRTLASSTDSGHRSLPSTAGNSPRRTAGPMRRHLSAAGSPRPHTAFEGRIICARTPMSKPASRSAATSASSSLEKRRRVSRDVSEIARRRPAEERKVRP